MVLGGLLVAGLVTGARSAHRHGTLSSIIRRLEESAATDSEREVLGRVKRAYANTGVLGRAWNKAGVFRMCAVLHRAHSCALGEDFREAIVELAQHFECRRPFV